MKIKVLLIFLLCATGTLVAQIDDNEMKSIDERGAAELVAAHNRYRTSAGVEPLAWSNDLASQAQKWADRLAKQGGRKIYHSNTEGQGENIWWGTSGAYTFSQMIEGWGSEGKYFKEGTFPDVSKDGKWESVGHYTQIVWRTTTRVGCAKASAGGYDILVCRYSPQGNIEGQKPY